MNRLLRSRSTIVLLVCLLAACGVDETLSLTPRVNPDASLSGAADSSGGAADGSDVALDTPDPAAPASPLPTGTSTRPATPIAPAVPSSASSGVNEHECANDRCDGGHCTPPPQCIVVEPCVPVLEVCDGVDNNCDGQVDELLLSVYFEDLDEDGAGSGAALYGCDVPEGYVEVTGDCDDTDPDNQTGCTRCRDQDADGWYAGCDAFEFRPGPDCNDGDPDNFESCDTCIDRDDDGAFVGCDQYLVRDLDCNDADPDNAGSCESCRDDDGDGAFVDCDDYVTRAGPDCNDADGDNQQSCDTCIDRDDDGVFVGCDAFVNRPGPDCNDLDATNQQACPTCADDDADGYYLSCDGFAGFLGPDCNDADTDNYTSCLTCVDADVDDSFVGCDRYIARNGPDCNDDDGDNQRSCGVCLDRDLDGYFANCDGFSTRNGPDCNDQDARYQTACDGPVPNGADCLDDGVEQTCFNGNDALVRAQPVDIFSHHIEGQLLAGGQDWYSLELPAGCSVDFSTATPDTARLAELSSSLFDAAGGPLSSITGRNPSLSHTAGNADQRVYLRTTTGSGIAVAYTVKIVSNCTSPGLRVALFGDQSLSTSATAVLELIAREQPDLVVHLGDFDYVDDPDAWETLMLGTLGPDLPYLSVIGNHDVPRWTPTSYDSTSYQEIVEQQHQRIRGLRCEGELGVQANCSYQGLHFVESAIGTLPNVPNDPERLAALRAGLESNKSLWRACLWHKNQRAMQLGSKGDEVGWLAFADCLAAGAMIFTGHEHSYSRTYTLTDFAAGAIETQFGMTGQPDQLDVDRGRTFVVVSGLGGHSLRAYNETLHGAEPPPWWATAYASNVYRSNGVLVDDFVPLFGALFMRFHIDGNPRLAEGVFKTTDGVEIDRFLVRSNH
jgi:hypothetical protein